MMIDSPDLRTKLARALAAGAPVAVVAAYLFGSYALGRAHRESDLDVGVLLPWDQAGGRRERFEAGIRLSGYLQAELRFAHVDLVVLNDVPPHLARHVVTEGIMLFSTDDEAERAFRRDAMLRAADLEPFLRRARRIKLEAMKK
jgi:predicted nucleotidyltransferase